MTAPLRSILRDARRLRAPQDEVCFAAKSQTLMVRSAACGASRTMQAEQSPRTWVAPGRASVDLGFLVIATVDQDFFPVGLVDNDGLEQIGRHDLHAIIIGGRVVHGD